VRQRERERKRKRERERVLHREIEREREREREKKKERERESKRGGTTNRLLLRLPPVLCKFQGPRLKKNWHKCATSPKWNN